MTFTVWFRAWTNFCLLMFMCRVVRPALTPSWKALTLLQSAVGNERRPLSRFVGPQNVISPEKPSMRDLKKEARKLVTTLPSPDEL